MKNMGEMRRTATIVAVFGLLAMMFYPIMSIASTAAEEEEVYFPDPDLEAAIREAINKPEGPIYVEDLEGLTELDASRRWIKDLTGLEYCTNLERLDLEDNWITDIKPLVDNPGLSFFNCVDLRENPLSETSIKVYIPQLEKRGVFVEW
jgi:Leucine-rich repeat (LRR) protein